MPRPIPTPVLHMTHIDRLPSIAQHGLLPDNEVVRRSLPGVEIGYQDIKQRRAQRLVPCGAGGTIADYVPFYFAPRSPMLYTITRGNVSREASQTEAIVYLVTTTQRLRQAGLTVVCSDRHPVRAYADLSDEDSRLDQPDFVDWPLMQATMWNDTADDPDRKDRRQAECLVNPHVPWACINAVVTKTQRMAEQAIDLLQSNAPTINVRPDWYF